MTIGLTPEQFKTVYEKASQIVSTVPKNYLYHDWDHSFLYVTPTAMHLATLEGHSDPKIRVVGAAGSFHDAGFTVQYDKNEPIGADLAAKYLAEVGANERTIAQARASILSTDLAVLPTTDLGAVLRDADTAVIGTPAMYCIAEKLRLEYLQLPNHPMKEAANSDKKWYTGQLEFLANHEFHTKSAKKLYNRGKEDNMRLHERLLKSAGDGNSIAWRYM